VEAKVPLRKPHDHYPFESGLDYKGYPIVARTTWVFKLYCYHNANVIEKGGIGPLFFWAKEKGDTFRIARLPNLGFAQTNIPTRITSCR
jgi:hypothetical protein